MFFNKVIELTLIYVLDAIKDSFLIPLLKHVKSVIQREKDVI